ncbi:hypothetical protein FRC14_001293 [Serendipita sp. 396]|nr:hypothetical protein FRC14_001293 [Serendipita sp. 396]KAG8780837.1 hypothetical protein FRC15_009251 [Serendipita sp. 397]KAG8789795.1 hypothetical protein FRC16_001157 [Serendipita sp. 398]KAG8853678.1 hypothetical protein FRC20_001172 [Serendipita sp. 405]
MLLSFLFFLATSVCVLGAPVTEEFTRCANSISPAQLISQEGRLSRDSEVALASVTDRESLISSLYKRTVHIVWHVIQESAALAGGNISDDDVKSSISELNKHYSGTTFNFVLDSITRTTNPDWFSSVYPQNTLQTDMKNSLHTGNGAVLNIYSAGFKTSTLLGYSAWPSDYGNYPSQDGVVVRFSTIPGGSLGNYNQGKTLTHEVGHWLGLYHVFNDAEICTEGDAVADTPIQSEPTFGCPSSKDSCPSEAGLDSIHNYMDYSYDVCMTEFTPGQIDRMKTQALTYRGIKPLLPFVIGSDILTLTYNPTITYVRPTGLIPFPTGILTGLIPVTGRPTFSLRPTIVPFPL